jgi:hypothetical protein
VVCPAPAARPIESRAIQAAAGIRFHVVQDFLGLRLAVNYNVHVIASHVGGKQSPISKLADCMHRAQYDYTTVFVEQVRLLHHNSSFGYRTIGIDLNRSSVGNIVPPIDRARFVAV